MSIYTATLCITRGEKDGKSIPLTVKFENYPGESNGPESFEGPFVSGPHLEDYTGSHFGCRTIMTTAALKGRKRQFCWTAGTGVEGRYHSLSFWKGQKCPARTLFVDVGEDCLRLTFENKEMLETVLSCRRAVFLSPDRDEKLLSSRTEAQEVSQPVLLMRGVHVLTPTQVREKVTALETEVGTSAKPSVVMGKLPMSETWASRVEGWKTDKKGPHISVMPDH